MIKPHIMIYSDKLGKAQMKLEKLISESGESIVKRTQQYAETETKKYSAYRYLQSCRGHRYQEVYIDEALKKDQETIEWITMKLRPYQHLSFEERLQDDCRDHIHFFKGDTE